MRRSMSSLLLLTVLSSGCAMITPTFVGTPRSPVDQTKLEVFFRAEDVPYKYQVIGKIYLKNINYWADRSPGAQAKAIQKKAAAAGADGVIIDDNRRVESSGYAMPSEVFQLSGLAIVRIQ